MLILDVEEHIASNASKVLPIVLVQRLLVPVTLSATLPAGNVQLFCVAKIRPHILHEQGELGLALLPLHLSDVIGLEVLLT
jgi:hypothetical protein